MPRGELGPADFQKALDGIGSRFPALKLDDLFVLWFLRSYVTRSEELAVEAVAGGAKDKGIDKASITRPSERRRKNARTSLALLK